MGYKKTLQQILKEPPPKELLYDEVCILLERLGYVEHENGSSHVVFRKAGCYSICLPRAGGSVVKQCYLRKIAEIIKNETEEPQ